MPVKDPGVSEITTLIVTKKVDTTKAKLKKNSFLGWSVSIFFYCKKGVMNFFKRM